MCYVPCFLLSRFTFPLTYLEEIRHAVRACYAVAFRVFHYDRIPLRGTIDYQSRETPKSLNKRSKLELIHEQLPLPVPCYDLLPVTELALGPREARLRAFPAPLS